MVKVYYKELFMSIVVMKITLINITFFVNYFIKRLAVTVHLLTFISLFAGLTHCLKKVYTQRSINKHYLTLLDVFETFELNGLL